MIMIPKYCLILLNPNEIDIDKTPSITNIGTEVAQAYFEEVEAMHIARVTRRCWPSPMTKRTEVADKPGGKW